MLYNLNKVDGNEHFAHISLTIRILHDISIRVFMHSERLPDSDLKWAFYLIRMDYYNFGVNWIMYYHPVLWLCSRAAEL